MSFDVFSVADSFAELKNLRDGDVDVVLTDPPRRGRKKPTREKQAAYTRKYRERMSPEQKELIKARDRARVANLSAEGKLKRTEARRRSEEGRWLRRLLQAAQSRGRRTGVAVTVTEAELQTLWGLQDGRCYWTAVPLVQARLSPWSASLDRLNPSGGYEAGNLVISSWWANRARHTRSVQEFRDILDQVIEQGRKL